MGAEEYLVRHCWLSWRLPPTRHRRQERSPSKLHALWACVAIILASLLLATSSPALGAQAEPGFSAEDYDRLIRRYTEGSPVESALALCKVPKDRVALASKSYGEHALTETEIKAVVLLHTEAAMFTETETRFHLETAQRWMDRLQDAKRQSFERRWFLMLGYAFMGSMQLMEAAGILQAALRAFPDDIEMRLALGVAYETAGWLRKDDSMLREAEQQYGLILLARPDLVEARVRRARVLKLLGRKEEAFRNLQSLRDETAEPWLLLAVYLTLGDIHEDRGESTDAIRAYRAATAIDPDCQAATVALAHALHKAGDPSEASELVARFLEDREVSLRKRDPGDAVSHDLWWRYCLGNFERFEALRQELREQVQP